VVIAAVIVIVLEVSIIVDEQRARLVKHIIDTICRRVASALCTVGRMTPITAAEWMANVDSARCVRQSSALGAICRVGGGSAIRFTLATVRLVRLRAELTRVRGGSARRGPFETVKTEPRPRQDVPAAARVE